MPKQNRTRNLARWIAGVACLSSLVHAGADDWPQWRGPKRDGVWRETGVVDKLPKGQLPLAWKADIGPGYSGPTVAAGRVYVTDRIVTQEQETERVLCFDANTGKRLWKHEYETSYADISYQAGPRASVTIDGDKVYSIGAAGNLFALDAASGATLWLRDCRTEYKIAMPIWGVSASPLVVGDLVVVHIGGTDGACVVAFDKTDGREIWKSLDERGQYSSPIVVDHAGKPTLVVWTGDSVAGLDAADGKPRWHVPWKPRNMPIGCASPVLDGRKLFFTSFYDGSLMLELSANEPTVKQTWKIVGADEKNTDALHSIISTPVVRDGHVYGVDSYGELRCLDAADGKRLWENLTATPKSRWSTIHFVQQGDDPKTCVDWLFNERGELLTGKLTPKGFEETSRAKLIEPTTEQLRQRNGVCWSHPAYADKAIFARNDKELVRANLGR